MESKPVKLGPISVKSKRERQIVLISAVAGIVMLGLAMRKKGTATTTDSGYSDIGGGGGGGTGGGGTGGYQDVLDKLDEIIKGGNGGGSGAGSGINLDLSYALDNSSSFSAESTFENSRRGDSISFGGGGFSFGFGGGGHTDKRTIGFDETTKDVFESDVSASNLSESQLGSILGFLKEVGGTYEQRNATTTSRGDKQRELALILQQQNLTGQVVIDTGVNRHLNGQTLEDSRDRIRIGI